ncbi:MAG: hypothetical protein V1740_05430 [Candidatus Woesearchaeota archaeon]
MPKPKTAEKSKKVLVTMPKDWLEIITQINGLGLNDAERVRNAVQSFLAQNGYFSKK